MDLGLKGKRAAIQASSTGIGFAFAEALQKEGAIVSICSNNQERLAIAAKALGSCHHFLIDLDQSGAGKEFVQKAVKAMGGIDLLITNAGGPKKGDFVELNAEDWQQGYERLWRSAVESILEAAPLMKKQSFGRILLNTSTAAKEPISHLTLSNAFRSGLLGLMKSLSRELAPFGITVNAILPGYTHTKRLEGWGKSLEELASHVPARRLGKPEELGALAAFLASTQAGYLTGQAIACDGGLLLGL